MNLIDAICRDLKLPRSTIESWIFSKSRRVKKFKIPKKSGGYRQIEHPCRELKTIQYWMSYRLFSNIPVDKAAVAYVRGTSILTNAEYHKNNKYFLKIDLENFFPSIVSTDLLRLLQPRFSTPRYPYAWTKNVEEIFAKVCFDERCRLPMGYPSSPLICNIVMREFDSKLRKILHENSSRIGRVRYTRYADDLFFSTKKPGVCNEILDLVRMQINACQSPNISINNKKTRFSSRSGGSAFLTGLRICEDGHITIHRKYKDSVRLKLGLLRKGNLAKSEYTSVRGCLAQIQNVDPKFYTKLQQKYFDEIRSLQI